MPPAPNHINPYPPHQLPPPSPALSQSSSSSSRGVVSPVPSLTNSEPGRDDQASSEDEEDELPLAKPETGLKVKSRLSDLIAAVSGKISKPSEQPDEESKEKESVNTNSLQEKWNSVFKAKKDIKENLNSAKFSNHQIPLEFEEGYLTSQRLVLGTKILVLQDGLLLPGIISGMEEDVFSISFRTLENSDKISQFSEEELIATSVLDIPAMSTDKLKSGTRVAVFPVQNSPHLVPGTVRKVINAYILQVTLDSGPVKDINCEHVRIIPTSFIPKKVFLNGFNHKTCEKVPISNTYGSNKNKPNILLGYDFVDTDKSDLQAQWETAISRKSNKKPEKKPTETVVESLEAVEQKPKPDRKLSINTEVQNTLNSIIDNVTDEEKMRQSLIFGALKKYSPKKEVIKPVKSPRSVEMPKPRKKKLKSRDGIKEESNETDDLTKELLSICKESNIDTPEKSRKVEVVIPPTLEHKPHIEEPLKDLDRSGSKLKINLDKDVEAQVDKEQGSGTGEEMCNSSEVDQTICNPEDLQDSKAEIEDMPMKKEERREPKNVDSTTKEEVLNKTKVDEEVVNSKSKTKVDEEVVNSKSKNKIDEEAVNSKTKTKVDEEAVNSKNKTNVEEEAVINKEDNKEDVGKNLLQNEEHLSPLNKDIKDEENAKKYLEDVKNSKNDSSKEKENKATPIGEVKEKKKIEQTEVESDLIEKNSEELHNSSLFPGEDVVLKNACNQEDQVDLKDETVANDSHEKEPRGRIFLNKTDLSKINETKENDKDIVKVEISSKPDELKTVDTDGIPLPLKSGQLKPEIQSDSTKLENSTSEDEAIRDPNPGKENLEVNSTKCYKGHIDDKTFYYVDPTFPQGWYIKVKLRSDLTKADSYFYPPCNTQLRSKAEIIKFLEGNLNNKPSKKRPGLPIRRMPARKDLDEKDFAFTLNIEPEIFQTKRKKGIKKKKKKIDSEGQCNEKDVSDNGVGNPGENVEIVKPESEENCFKVPTMENLRMLRSRKNVKNSKSLKLKKKSDSGTEVLEENNLQKNSNVIEDGNKSEITEDNTESNCPASDQKNETEISSQPKKDQCNKEDVEATKDDIKTETEKSVENDIKDPSSPIKRTLRSARKSKKRKTRSDSTETETKPTPKRVFKKRELRSTRSNSKAEDEKPGEDDIAPPGKELPKEDVIVSAIIKTESEDTELSLDFTTTGEIKDSGKRTYCEQTSSTSIEPSRVGIAKLKPHQRPKLRGPASKRKYSLTSSESEDDEPIEKLVKKENEETPTTFEIDIHSDSNLRTSCSASVVNLFNRRLLETPCGHCTAPGQFSAESLEIDLPSNLIFIECNLCSWTTVRKISVQSKIIC